MIFRAGCEDHIVDLEDNYYKVKYTDEVKMDNDIWKRVKDVSLGDKILTSDNVYDEIKDIKLIGDYYYLYV